MLGLCVNAFVSYLLLPNSVKYEIFPFAYIHTASEACQITLFGLSSMQKMTRTLSLNYKRQFFMKNSHILLYSSWKVVNRGLSTKMKKISSDDIFASEKQKRSTQNRIWHKIASMLIFALQFAIKIWPFQCFLLGRRLLSPVSFPKEISALVLMHPSPKRSQQQDQTWFLPSLINMVVPCYHLNRERNKSILWSPEQ